ncbi:MAG: ATP-binding cassette domain-containing protein [Propionibacteriaceae bacterium]|nr:ATP-binding cassette domain-containing protein [Propionibacteriaceae bacterium]
MIEFTGVGKHYGSVAALNDVSATVEPGRVTCLLGPNGAGKSTLMRVLLGLDHPTAGQATIDGMSYARLPHPLAAVGAHLGGRPFQPRRSARGHLLGLARAQRIPASRVDAVLEQTGLSAVARQAAGSFSLGMSQRLGIASALLGDPSHIVLDEPVNGLDTDGVRWIRELLLRLAGGGRTVLLSSHLMSEVQLVASHVIVLGRGRLLADVPTRDLESRARDEVVLHTQPPGDVTDAAERLSSRLVGDVTATERRLDDRTVEIRLTGTTEADVGRAAFDLGWPVLRLLRDVADLEQGYLSLVQGQADFVALPSEGTHHSEKRDNGLTRFSENRQLPSEVTRPTGKEAS